MSTWTFLISGLGCIALALFLVHSPMLALGRNSYEDVLRDGLAAGLLLAVAALMRLPARPGGAFGSLAALSLAPVVSFTIATMLSVHPAVSVLAGSGLGLSMIPVLRERGVLSLVWVSLMVSLALIGARRQSLVLAQEVSELQLLQALIQEGGRQRHFVSVDASYPLQRRKSLALSLWPADPTRRIDLVCVDAGGEVERELSAGGWRGLRIEDRGPLILEPQAAERTDGITFRRAELGAGGPILEVAEVLAGGYLLLVLTPCGILSEFYESLPAQLTLSPEHQESYQNLIAGLPAGMPILLRLEASLGPAKSAWTLLRIH